MHTIEGLQHNLHTGEIHAAETQILTLAMQASFPISHGYLTTSTAGSMSGIWTKRVPMLKSHLTGQQVLVFEDKTTGEKKNKRLQEK